MTKQTNRNEPDQNPIIINRPEKLSSVKKIAEWSVTAFGWGLWFFFCRPLLIAFLWFLGFEAFYVHMIRLQGLRSVIVFFESYVFVILTLLLVARGWSFYNQMRFGQRGKRKGAPEVKPDELDHYFNMKEGSAAKLQSWKEIQIDFSPDYHLEFHRVGSLEASPLKGQYRVVRFKHPRAKK